MALKIGGYSRVVTITGSYVVQGHEDVILCNASGGAFSVTLPAASSIGEKIVTIKKIDTSSNAVTVSRSGTDTIDGYASVPILVRNSNLSAVSNGQNWYIVDEPERIALRYRTLGAVSISTTQPIDFADSVYAPSPYVTTGSSWRFTTPSPGWYHIDVAVDLDAGTYAGLYKNGTLLNDIANCGYNDFYGTGSDTIYLLSGDYIDIRTTGGSTSTSTSTGKNWISIFKI